MSKFGWITGVNLLETLWFAKVYDALGGQIYLTQRTSELALKLFVKGFNRGMNPAFQPFPRFSLQFQRHFDPVYELVT